MNVKVFNFGQIQISITILIKNFCTSVHVSFLNAPVLAGEDLLSVPVFVSQLFRVAHRLKISANVGRTVFAVLWPLVGRLVTSDVKVQGGFRKVGEILGGVNEYVTHIFGSFPSDQ